MRAYLALVVLLGFCGAPGGSGRLANEKARPGGDRRSGSAVQLGITRSPAMAGGRALRAAPASAHLPTLPITRISSKCSNTSRARSWGPWSPATTRSSAGSISSGRGSEGDRISTEPDNPLYGGKTQPRLSTRRSSPPFGGDAGSARHPEPFIFTARSALEISTAGPSWTCQCPFGLCNGTEIGRQRLDRSGCWLRCAVRYNDSCFMNMLADLGGWSTARLDRRSPRSATIGRRTSPRRVGYRVMYNYTHWTRALKPAPSAEELPLPAVDVRAVCRGQI